MKALWKGFSSVIANSAQAYLEHKRALARKFDNEERVLQLLDRFLLEHRVADVTAIDSTLVDLFLCSRARQPARSYNHLLGVVRGFFAWLVLQEQLQQSPVRAKPRRCTASLQPFLFNTRMMADLLDRAAALPDQPKAPDRGQSYYLMFALMYALGLRVGEVCRLQYADVDLQRQLLRINRTKFAKDRLVPFGPRVARRLDDYLSRSNNRADRSTAQNNEAPVFSFCGGRAVNPCTVSQIFHRLVEGHYDIPPGVGTPRLHCLRHSFAVGMLLRWYRSGENPGDKLVHLSTFLGHVDPNSTAWYLTITAELLDSANERFERFAPIDTREIPS